MIPLSVPSYGDWSLAVVYTLIFALLAFCLYRPKTGRDWQAFGAFAFFLVALFAEMFGFPLTLYLLAGFGSPTSPSIQSLPHEIGQLLGMMFDWRANRPFGIFQIASTVLILGGFTLLAGAWATLHKAHQRRELARTGVYARVRHPEYAAFILIMTGFLLQWPTLVTLFMFPLLVLFYARRARAEEQEALERFGEPYQRYLSKTPAFIPRVTSRTAQA